jgi:hypothetical protein
VSAAYGAFIMRKAAVLLVGALALLLFIGASMIQSLFVIQRFAAVREVSGKVEVKAAGEEAFGPLGDARHVRAGDVVRTAEDGGVTLNWVDGSRIRLGPNTEMTVLQCQIDKTKQAQSYLFKLDVGQVWVRVLQTLGRQSKFEIQTPTATAAVRGTVFSVEVDDAGATTVSVLKGEVALEGAGSNLSVRERQEAAVSVSETRPTRPMTPERETEWEVARVVAEPWLRLTQPASDGLPQGASFLSVSGDTERGAVVTVNGKPVVPNMMQSFTVDVPIPEGAEEFEITARARDAKGFETVVVKRLSR